jgi:hypothetical protein
MASCLNAAYGGSGMGIGRLGDPDIIHKRKFRWVFQISFCNFQKTVPAYFVKTASRPDLSIEETEINFLNEKTWIPGKPTWESITVTYYDVATDDNIHLWSWIASVYDFTNPTCRYMNSKRQDYAGTGFLEMLDGCGQSLEEWLFHDMWPTSVKFGDLDYSNSDVMDIEVTLRYSSIQYFNNCGAQPERCPCSPCNQGALSGGGGGGGGGGGLNSSSSLITN